MKDLEKDEKLVNIFAWFLAICLVTSEPLLIRNYILSGEMNYLAIALVGGGLLLAKIIHLVKIKRSLKYDKQNPKILR